MAIKADKLCSANKIDAMVVTLPEDISSECGMAIEANSCDKELIISTFDSEKIEYIIYDRPAAI